MLSPEEFKAQWGTNDLVRYDEANVDALSIPDFSKRFLVEAGLPQRFYNAGSMTFRPLREFPPIGRTFGNVYALPEECQAYRVFNVVGYEDAGPSDNVSVFFCLDEQTNGRVMTVYRTGKLSFRNSDVVRFAEFLLIIRQYNNWILRRNQEQDQFDRPFTCDELEAMGHQVRRKLQRVDPDAFLVPESREYSAWEAFLLQNETATGCSP